jgi:hypothetical protein
MPPQEDERCGFVNVVRCANVALRLHATSLNVCSRAPAAGEEPISREDKRYAAIAYVGFASLTLF